MFFAVSKPIKPLLILRFKMKDILPVFCIQQDLRMCHLVRFLPSWLMKRLILLLSRTIRLKMHQLLLQFKLLHQLQLQRLLLQHQLLQFQFKLQLQLPLRPLAQEFLPALSPKTSPTQAESPSLASKEPVHLAESSLLTLRMPSLPHQSPPLPPPSSPACLLQVSSISKTQILEKSSLIDLLSQSRTSPIITLLYRFPSITS
jgi:hypothetical protein